MMLTRCPACRTAFRVTPMQLNSHAGKVRCGQCHGVFNALQTLEEAQATAPAAADAEVTAPEATRPAAPITAEHEAGAAIPDLAPSATEAQPPAHARLRVLGWSGAVLAMLALGVVQAAHTFRSDLAAGAPDLRPALVAMCEMLDCDLPLPRKADLVGIEASDLHPEPKQGKLLILSATLRNRAGYAQAYPSLELTLTDTHDQPLVRRVLGPADYLPTGTDAGSGFAATSDLAISIWLDAAGVAATGYRLYVFYP